MGNKMKNLIKPMMVLILVLSSTAASASIIDYLEIDLRTSQWVGARGANSYTVNDVTVTALPGTLSLYQDNIDGIGILGGEPDEINFGETLDISFASSAALTGVWITDLFPSPDGGVNGEEGYLELFLTNGSSSILSFIGNQSHAANGEQWIDFGGSVDVASISFTTDAKYSSEFSVAGFTTIPEANTISMFVLGLFLLSVYRRKQA